MLEFQRSVNQELFYYILGGFYEHRGDDTYENETFIYRPYDWNFDGEDSERPANLEHKASGFKLWWYKYPLRSPEVNMMITSEQFSDILYDCYDSMYTYGSHEIKKWWESAGGGCRMVSLAAFYFICFALYFVGIYKTSRPKTNCDVYEGWILMIGVAAAALAQTLELTQV